MIDFKAAMTSKIDVDEILDINDSFSRNLFFVVMFKNNKENKYYVVTFFPDRTLGPDDKGRI